MSIIENVTGWRQPVVPPTNSEKLSSWAGPAYVAGTLANYPRPVGTHKPAAKVSNKENRRGV